MLNEEVTTMFTTWKNNFIVDKDDIIAVNDVIFSLLLEIFVFALLYAMNVYGVLNNDIIITINI